MSNWISCAERMPALKDSPNSLFWCWDGKTVELLESYGYEDFDAPADGFCHEASGIVAGITHWQPALPPSPPD